MSDQNNKFTRPTNPPPKLFFGDKERDYVKQINDEILERIIGQEIVYYPISLEHSNYHSLYGECIEKNFLDPIRVYALIEWEGQTTDTSNIGVDKKSSIVVHFHKRRLTEDQNLEVKIGDHLLYGNFLYEIVTLNEPRQLFGYVEHKIEISATCIRTRKGTFNL